jgi:hypothetical protein
MAEPRWPHLAPTWPARDALAVLAAAPTPEQGRRLSQTRIETLLRRGGRQPNLAATAAKIKTALGSEQVKARIRLKPTISQQAGEDAKYQADPADYRTRLQAWNDNATLPSRQPMRLPTPSKVGSSRLSTRSTNWCPRSSNGTFPRAWVTSAGRSTTGSGSLLGTRIE